MGKNANINRRKRVKELKKNYLLAHCCLECGTDKDLTFHHVDPKTKEFNIGGKPTVSITKFFEEAQKCVVLCDRCHKRVHASERFI